MWMIRLTPRDEAIIEFLNEVKVADTQTLCNIFFKFTYHIVNIKPQPTNKHFQQFRYILYIVFCSNPLIMF